MIVVGIDPGVNTGLAVWDTSTRQFLDIRCSGIVDAMRYLAELQEQRQIGLLVFEDARQRKWIPREKDLKQFKGRAMGAGSVKRDCSIWEEWCQTYRIDCVKTPPRQGMTKWTDAVFRGVTGYDARTNNHGRDAAMLVFGR
jgi:hypothetical protein